MVHKFDGYNYLAKLYKGERLSEAIEQFVQETGIKGGWVNGLGAATEVTLGFYDLEAKDYQWRTFKDLLECVSLTGNLAFNERGKMMFHLHGVFSDRQFQTVGGHVKDLVVGATLELFIHCAYKPVHRKTDSQVGLQTLDL